MPEEEQEPLFVSDAGEIRTFPGYADLARTAPPPWEVWPAAVQPPVPGQVVYRRLPVDGSPLQEGIRRLIRERDEARDQVRFLVEFAETVTVQQGFPAPISERLNSLWRRWHDLWRSLQNTAWFREWDS